MTQIFGSGLTPRDRIEDSATLQRHLLQGLERQWLELWGQANQMQTRAQAVRDDGAANARDASSNSPKALDAGSVMGLTAAPAQREAARGSVALIAVSGRMREELSAEMEVVGGGGQFKESRPPIEGAGPTPVGLLNGTAAAGKRGAVDETVRSHKVTAFDTAFTRVAAPRSIASRAEDRVMNEASDSGAAAKEQATAPPVASQQLAAGLRGPSFGADQVGAVLSMAIVPVRRGDEVAQGAPPDRVGANALAFFNVDAPQDAVSALPSPRVALSLTAVAARSLAAPVAAEDAWAESKAVPRRFASASADAEPTPQHLMLREVDEQAVLASMRDAHLSSHESQLAAQELARALMQAGYARVQVVVNGHQQRLGEPLTEDGLGDETGSPAEPSTSTTQDIQAVQHGN